MFKDFHGFFLTSNVQFWHYHDLTYIPITYHQNNSSTKKKKRKQKRRPPFCLYGLYDYMGYIVLSGYIWAYQAPYSGYMEWGLLIHTSTLLDLNMYYSISLVKNCTKKKYFKNICAQREICPLKSVLKTKSRENR